MSRQEYEPGREMGGESSMKTPHMGASQVSQYLRGVNFPADKQKIVDMAKSNGAPDPIVQMLNRLPSKQYNRQNEIEEEFGKMK